MILKLDLQSKTPIYEQLVNEIIQGIAMGKLREGDSLPSVRQLGVDLGINLHTVNKSYNLLKQQGFVFIHRQKGAIINPKENYIKNDVYLTSLQQKLKTMILEAYCRQVSKNGFISFCETLYDEIERDG